MLVLLVLKYYSMFMVFADRHLESESTTKNKSPEAQNDIKMHFYDFYQINLYVFNKFQIYFINYSGF